MPKREEKRRIDKRSKFGKQRLRPHPLDCFGDVEGHGERFIKTPKGVGPGMSNTALQK